MADVQEFLRRIQALEGQVQRLDQRIKAIPQGGRGTQETSPNILLGSLPAILKRILRYGFEWIGNLVDVKAKLNEGIAVDIDGVATKRKVGGGVLCDADGLYVSGEEVGMDPLSGYRISDMDTAGDPHYYGFEDKDGNWYIMEYGVGADTFRYLAGSSGYAAAWAGRVGPTYLLFENAF